MWKTGLALALAFGLAGTAHASSDDGCPDGQWMLPSPTQACASRIVIAPGNDSRINLALLASDAAGQRFDAPAYPAAIPWQGSEFGHLFLNWQLLRDALFPPPPRKDSDGWVDTSGARCDGLDRAGRDFAAALAGDKALPAAERDTLNAARERLAGVCGRRHSDSNPGQAQPKPLPDWPRTVASEPGRAFLAYLQATEAFYTEQWDAARDGFAPLQAAREPWVAETARYMAVRVEIGAAQAPAFDRYGSYAGLAKVDQAAVKRAVAALAVYDKAFPAGRYRASLDGLERRLMWLSGDFSGLDTRYGQMLGATPPHAAAALDLVAEIDLKLLFNPDNAHPASRNPLMAAALDLVAMRQGGDPHTALLSREALAAQAPIFAGTPDLYAFVQATQAYYVRRDYAAVLALIPDASHQAAYRPLAFSAQMMRGMALAASGSSDETRFWRDLLKGANAIWQGPNVQLGLARDLERHGQVAAVFAPGSGVVDPDLRAILIDHSAGPGVLRKLATGDALNPDEQHRALFTLLYKFLSRGDFPGFLGARPLAVGVPPPPERAPDDYSPHPPSPTVFITGKTSEAYPCPALDATVGILANHRSDPHAQICLGEFLRLNGLDGVQSPDIAPQADQLGGTAHDFPGQTLGRGPLYLAVIADAHAAGEDKAYALYRLVRCYAPSGYDSCGGLSLTNPERKALFLRLKHDYPASPWAQKLRFYW